MNRWKKMALAVLVAAAGAGLAFGAYRIGDWGEGGEHNLTNVPLTTVQRGPLEITVSASGTIQNREQVVIKNEVEGRTTILWLVEEGKQVEKGDLLVELDASDLREKKTSQQMSVMNAEAAFVRAREDLAVTRNKAESDVAKAKLDYEFAQQDLDQYKKGEYPQALREARSRITIAEEELTRAEEKLESSRVLAEENYVSRVELEADRLAAHKAELELELAKGKLQLLTDYTYGRRVAELESDVDQARMALDRVKRQSKANVVQAEAEFKAKESQYERQKSKLKKIEDQIAKCRLEAPIGGMVVYATTGRGGWRRNSEPLEEGQEVRERQELIHLPTASAMLAEVKVHEANLKKVDTGMNARIAVDALPGKRFSGTVDKIAILPDAQRAWLNPNLKVYDTRVTVDDESEGLRPGMSCRAEILVRSFEDVLYVPLQCVVRPGGYPTVYVAAAGNIKPRQVETGLDNNKFVRILSGLQEGERVLLAPPIGAGAGGGGKTRRDSTVPGTGGDGVRQKGGSDSGGTVKRSSGAADSRRQAADDGRAAGRAGNYAQTERNRSEEGSRRARKNVAADDRASQPGNRSGSVRKRNVRSRSAQAGP